jgi:rhodanese-related sulfurtransferase
MPMGMKDLVAEARAHVSAVAPQQAKDDADVILDVREPAELDSTGRIAGALNIPRGILESRADPESSAADQRLTRLRGSGRVHVLCASGARAALAAHTLSRMGYEASVIEGGMSGWKQAGLPVEG